MQAFLGDTNHLNPFQLGFRLHHGTDAALVTLLKDLQREANQKILLDLSVTFDTTNQAMPTASRH